MLDTQGGLAADDIVTPWTPDRMLTRLGGDEDLARQLAALFLEECPQMLERVRQSVQQTDPDVVRRAAHAFKGSVANFVEGGAAASAFELEAMGRDNRLSDAPAVLERLEREIAALLVDLRRFAEGA
jgi:HPt (histidine-containing phosphotransfer) domain-containing protein